MKLSIVTPSFNQGEYLERTLLSVVSQLTDAHEYIVVDGMSDDGSHEILRRYADQLTSLIIEPDEGQADAIAKGFSQATGEILAYLNSDDLFLPGTLNYVSEYFAQHPEVDVLYGNRIFVDSDDKITGYWILPPHFDYCMSRWDFIPQETCFWRRSLMVKAGTVDSSFGFALDYDLFVRMMKLGTFKHEPKFLAAFRVHPKAKSSVLYETLGRQEVARVQVDQGISPNWYDWVLKYCFGGSILTVSFLYKVFSRNRGLNLKSGSLGG